MPSFAAPWNLSRERSFDRLRQEAQFAGADAVIGIEMTAQAFLGDPGNVEYVVFGTAVRENTPGPRTGSGPRMCALSGQDVVKLRRIGAETVGVIGHTSVVCVALSGWANQMMRSWWGNQEMVEVTQGVYAARRLAMDEVRRQASAAGANEMVISDLTHQIDHHEYERAAATRQHVFIVSMHVLGHRDRARRARAPSRSARRAGDVDQPRRLNPGEHPCRPTTRPAPKASPSTPASACKMNARGLFTSDLSVNEYLCVEKAGFEPVGLVVGSSIYHIGYQQSNWKASQEMGVLTQAMYSARELAMTRMEEEADQLGADGIVGVRLDVGRYEWGADMAEFIAIGTAIKHKGGKVHRAPNGRPFTSDLSGQAFWTLMQTGKRPVGLVMGNCVYHVAHRGMMQSMRQTGQNVELEQYTQALYDARELAMERMQKEAEEIGDGVLGIVEVKLHENNHGWGSHVIEFFALGTAVVPNEHAEPGQQLPDITPVIDIND